MVDRILKCNGNEDEQLLKEIFNEKNARYIFYYAKYIKTKHLETLTDELIKLDDIKYIGYYFTQIKNINYDQLLDKIITSNDNKVLFYSIVDKKDIDEKYIVKVIKILENRKEISYLIRILYYYFIERKFSNKEMLNILKNIDITFESDDVDKIFEYLKNKYQEQILYKDSLSENHFQGRNDFIPDIIVCHIASEFNHATNIFMNKDSKVSSHYLISSTGIIKKFVNLNDAAWANGTSLTDASDVYYLLSNNKIVKSRKANANYYAYSIEFESLDGTLTEKQYQSGLKVINMIINHMKNKYHHEFIIDREHLIGHSDITPITRIVDPGDKFPFDKFISDLQKNKITVVE